MKSNTEADDPTLSQNFKGHKDTVNAVSFNPNM